MDLYKYQVFVESLLNINLQINDGFFSFTRFADVEIEEKFQVDREKRDKFQKILSDIVLICGYVASLIYIFMAFYKLSFLIICMGCFAISLVLIILTYFIKNRKIIYIFNNLEIILIGLSLNVKGNLLNFYYNNSENDNYAELLRIIIYDFVSGNLFVLLKLEANFFVNMTHFLLNFFLIITSTLYANSNHFYFLEGLTSFLFTFIFFFFRKVWDHRMRVIFAEKYKFERLYKYSTDFIVGLNAYHISIKNNEIMYSDEKLNKILMKCNENLEEFPKIIGNINNNGNYETKNLKDNLNFILDDELNINKNFNEKINNKNIKETIDVYVEPDSKNVLQPVTIEKNNVTSRFNANSKSKTNLGADATMTAATNQIFYKSQQNSVLKYFLQNLFLYVDEKKNKEAKNQANKKNIYQKNYQESVGKFEHDNINLVNTEQENLKDKSDYFTSNKLFNETKSLFSLINKIKKEEDYNHCDNIDIKNFANDNNGNTEKVNLNINPGVKSKLEKNFEKFESGDVDHNNNYKKKENLLKNFLDFTEENIDQKENFRHSSFIHLGIYYLKILEIKQYFDVFYRRICIDGIIVYDFLFYDISELITSKQIIFEENTIKQKILAKIAHEFKTPMNSIIGLINNLRENLTNNLVDIYTNPYNLNLDNSQSGSRDAIKIRRKETSDLHNLSFESSKKLKNLKSKNLKILEIIQNLSKYIIFLVSDIIHYSSLKDINQLNLTYDKVNMKEIANFSMAILNCLLKCNKSKYDHIKTELKFEEEIKNIILRIDEIRLKQIILNIISNAVKFTKCGTIKVKFKIEDNFQNIRITISDTGIGIKESDKEKLFNDFVMLRDGKSLNSQGSGLGLSICKSLAKKMDIKLNFESKYGKGTKFFIYIPISSDFNRSSKNILANLKNLFKNEKEKKIFNDLKKSIEANCYSTRDNKRKTNKITKVNYTKKNYLYSYYINNSESKKF